MPPHHLVSSQAVDFTFRHRCRTGVRQLGRTTSYSRVICAVPPAKNGDYAWVQHMVASMAAGTGRMAVVLPQGALFRKSAEGRIRRALLERDLVEAVIGLARTRLAKSVHDAGWATLVRLLEEKAERWHRQVVKVGRWFPSSQLCSQCGLASGRKPLQVRDWTCDGCGVTHDRDRNAALNVLIEGRKVAAGLAETVNACGADVRPGPVPAVGSETGTHRNAA